MSTRISPDEKASIVGLRDELSTAEIASRFGISKRAVLNILARSGVPRTVKSVPPEVAADMVLMYKSGISQREIAQRTGFCRSIVGDYVRAALGSYAKRREATKKDVAHGQSDAEIRRMIARDLREYNRSIVSSGWTASSLSGNWA